MQSIRRPRECAGAESRGSPGTPEIQVGAAAAARWTHQHLAVESGPEEWNVFRGPGNEGSFAGEEVA